MSTSNHTVLDLNKVQHATYYYRNQYGQTIRLKPKQPTVRKQVFDHDAWCLAQPGYTMLQYATSHKLLDVWVPEIRFQLTANHSLPYTGKKATLMWKAWNEKIFNKKG